MQNLLVSVHSQHINLNSLFSGFDIKMTIQSDTSEEKSLYVKTTNALVLQTIELPSDTTSVQLTATGHGFAVFQLSYRYNIIEASTYAFTLTPKVVSMTAGRLDLKVCSRFVENNSQMKNTHPKIVQLNSLVPFY